MWKQRGMEDTNKALSVNMIKAHMSSQRVMQHAQDHYRAAPGPRPIIHYGFLSSVYGNPECANKWVSKFCAFSSTLFLLFVMSNSNMMVLFSYYLLEVWFFFFFLMRDRREVDLYGVGSGEELGGVGGKL